MYVFIMSRVIPWFWTYPSRTAWKRATAAGDTASSRSRCLPLGSASGTASVTATVAVTLTVTAIVIVIVTASSSWWPLLGQLAQLSCSSRAWLTHRGRLRIVSLYSICICGSSFVLLPMTRCFSLSRCQSNGR